MVISQGAQVWLGNVGKGRCLSNVVHYYSKRFPRVSKPKDQLRYRSYSTMGLRLSGMKVLRIHDDEGGVRDPEDPVSCQS